MEPFRVSTMCMGSPTTASTSGWRPETRCRPSTLPAGRRCARLMSPRMQERLSTASICFSLPKIAFRQSIRRLAVCSPPSLHPAAAVTQDSRGPKDAWVGQYRDRKIHQIDPQTGVILRTIEVQPLRHRGHLGRRRTMARHLGRRRERLTASRPSNWRVLERLEMPPGVGVSGLESDGGDRFFCGGGRSGRVQSRSPAQASTLSEMESHPPAAAQFRCETAFVSGASPSADVCRPGAERKRRGTRALPRRRGVEAHPPRGLPGPRAASRDSTGPP